MRLSKYWRHPLNRRCVIAGFILSLAAAIALHYYGVVRAWVPSWIVAVTCVTFVFYAYDKLIAGTRMTRIPERVLLLLCFFGGTAGALAAMLLLRHKTRKALFQMRLIILMIFQGTLLYIYLYYSGGLQ